MVGIISTLGLFTSTSAASSAADPIKTSFYDYRSAFKSKDLYEIKCLPKCLFETHSLLISIIMRKHFTTKRYKDNFHEIQIRRWPCPTYALSMRATQVMNSKPRKKGYRLKVDTLSMPLRPRRFKLNQKCLSCHESLTSDTWIPHSDKYLGRGNTTAF